MEAAAFPFDVYALGRCRLDRCNCTGCKECSKPQAHEKYLEQCGYCGQNAKSQSWNYTISERTLCSSCHSFWTLSPTKPVRPTNEEKNYIFVWRKAFINWGVLTTTQTPRPDVFDYELRCFLNPDGSPIEEAVDQAIVPVRSETQTMPQPLVPFHQAIISMQTEIRELRERVRAIEAWALEVGYTRRE